MRQVPIRIETNEDDLTQTEKLTLAEFMNQMDKHFALCILHKMREKKAVSTVHDKILTAPDYIKKEISLAYLRVLDEMPNPLFLIYFFLIKNLFDTNLLDDSAS